MFSLNSQISSWQNFSANRELAQGLFCAFGSMPVDDVILEVYIELLPISYRSRIRLEAVYHEQQAWQDKVECGAEKAYRATKPHTDVHINSEKLSRRSLCRKRHRSSRKVKLPSTISICSVPAAALSSFPSSSHPSSARSCARPQLDMDL